MKLDEDRCWAHLVGARHGVLATVHPTRGVDAVPVVFAVLPPQPGGGHRTIVIPIDTLKPKRSSRLQRLANVEGDPRCVLLIDHYAEQWSRLWWVQVHSRAAWSEPNDGVLAALAHRYPRYSEPGSVVGVISLDPTRVTGWGADAGELPA